MFFFDAVFYDLKCHHEYGLGYGFQDEMNFNFFVNCLDEFFSSQSSGFVSFKCFVGNAAFKTFQCQLSFRGQICGCQVVIDSVYGFDMVKMKRSWWLSRAFQTKSILLIGCCFCFQLIFEKKFGKSAIFLSLSQFIDWSILERFCYLSYILASLYLNTLPISYGLHYVLAKICLISDPLMKILA